MSTKSFFKKIIKSKKPIFLSLLFAVVLAGCGEKSTNSLTIFTIGDSTMANKSEKAYPETGWGQVLPEFFDTLVSIQNHAVNGRSSKSFMGEGKWKVVYDQIKPGDYVFIQFGHNDQKDKSPDRYTNPYTEYRQNLYTYIDSTRKKGATPILFTSIVRRNYNEQGCLIDTHGAYTEVVRAVSSEKNVILVDMQAISEKLVLSLGEEGSKSLYMHLAPGEYEQHPEGKEDDTHLKEYGAKTLANLAMKDLASKCPKLKAYIRTTD